jgi:hypothetical protein
MKAVPSSESNNNFLQDCKVSDPRKQLANPYCLIRCRIQRSRCLYPFEEWSLPNHHHRHIYGLVLAWSVPSTWRVCWSRHLTCGRPMFRLLFELYVEIFFWIPLSSIRRTWCSHCDLDFRLLLFRLKMSNFSLILVFLIWFLCSMLHS